METVIGRLTSFAASVECISKSLEENSSDDLILKNVSFIQEVLTSSWVQSFKNHQQDSCGEHNFQLKFFSKQLEEVVVGLWNATVTRQCAKSLHDRTIAILRQLCLDLFTSPFCAYCDSSNASEAKSKSYMHRRLMMSIKCGKAWLEMSEWEKAKDVFLFAQNDIESLLDVVLKQSAEAAASAVENEETLMIRKHQASVLCYLAEMEFGLGNCDQSFLYLQEASSLQHLKEDTGEKVKFLKEKERVCTLSYNFGLKSANHHKLDEAIRWLKFSSEYAKQIDELDKSLQAQSFRLLAHTYCETGIQDNLDKALEAVQLANSFSCQPVGLHLK